MREEAARAPRFRPALLRSLEGYDQGRFLKDLGAGAIVGVVAIPLALAFAIASGVKPESGLATAVVAGLVISLLGGSRVQIGGPTGAFVVIVYGIVAREGVEGLAIATVMAGVLLVLFGLIRAGTVIEYIPEPVIVGFTAGIGAIIFVGQLKEILGLRGLALPPDAGGKLLAIGRHLGAAEPWAIAVALGTIATILCAKRFVPRVPGPVVALVVFTLVAVLLHLPVETIGDRFGTLPAGMSFTPLHGISLDRLKELVPSAIAIALLGAIESLLSAVVSDAMIGDKHDSNTELIAQGVANLLSPLFGGMPATGAIARTATNVQNGATSPVAGLTHAVVVFGSLALLPAVMAHIPLAVLGGILAVVAWYMSDVPRLLGIARLPRPDALVLATTFLLTVLVDLVVAVEVGMVLAAFLFMRSMSQVARVQRSRLAGASDESGGRQQPMAGKTVPPGVAVYSIDGPFFFGAAERFQRTLARIDGYPPVVILRMRNVPYVDATGLSVFQEVVSRFLGHGTTVILSAVQPDPLRTMERGGLVARIGAENIVAHVDAALERASVVLEARLIGAVAARPR